MITTATIACAALFGGMLAFAGLFAPLAFARLPKEVADSFVRGIFPIYYLVMAGLAAAGAAALAGARPTEAVVLALVGAAFVVSRQALMPLVNRLYDRRQAGDETVNGWLERLHRLSALLNMAQLLAVLGILISLAQ